MSGHSKWAKLKHVKGASDAKKSKLFSLHARLITMASKQAKGDKNSAVVRAAVERAKKDNMPSENIDRAILKGAGGDSGNDQEVVYEAFGPGGIAIIVEGVTDNSNRTTSQIKHILTSHGGSLGGQGSATWAFTKTHEGWKANSPMDIEEKDAEKLDNLLEDLENNEDIKNIYTTLPEDEEQGER